MCSPQCSTVYYEYDENETILPNANINALKYYAFDVLFKKNSNVALPTILSLFIIPQ